MTLGDAISSGDMELIATYCEIEDVRGHTMQGPCLSVAVRTRNADIVRLLLDRGAVPDAEMLAEAVNLRSVDMLKMFLDHGAPPNADALAAAVGTRSMDMVKMLLDRGADPKVEGLLQLAVELASRGVNGGTPLEAQVSEDIALLLLQHGARGPVQRSRLRCSARLVSALASRSCWVPACEAAPARLEDDLLQHKLDRELSLSTSRLRAATKSSRQREKYLRDGRHGNSERLSKRGGRHKGGEGLVEVPA